MEAKKPKPHDHKCRYKCTENISEEERSTICQRFYALADYRRQHDFVCQRISVHPLGKRKGCKNTRSCSKKYTFQVNNKIFRVCEAFFIRTLAISKKYVDTAMLGRTPEGVFHGMDQRGRHPPAHKTSDDALQFVRRHIASYPAVEAHYVRKDTKKRYLESSLTIQGMYRNYKVKCAIESTKPVGITVFRRVFNTEFNLAFHRPKKDQCPVCEKHKNLTPEEKEANREEYEAHVQRNKRAQQEKAADKAAAETDKSIKSITFDLQSVLYTPCSLVSTIYYIKKLCTYNLTIYDQDRPHDVYCFVWNETDGRRGALEIATCLYRYLSYLPTTVQSVRFFSDSCIGQNRNRYVSFALALAVQRYPSIRVIDQKFLETGHTYMECDSCHSAIETAKKHRRVNSPEQWDALIAGARVDNPYKVHRLSYADFLDFKVACDQVWPASLRDEEGEKMSWYEIRWVRVEKTRPGVVKFKRSFDDVEFQEIRMNLKRGRAVQSLANMKLVSAYKNRLPISDDKKRALLALCENHIIPKDYHGFYSELPSSTKVQDTLDDPELDMEEEQGKNFRF